MFFSFVLVLTGGGDRRFKRRDFSMEKTDGFYLENRVEGRGFRRNGQKKRKKKENRILILEIPEIRPSIGSNKFCQETSKNVIVIN